MFKFAFHEKYNSVSLTDDAQPFLSFSSETSEIHPTQPKRSLSPCIIAIILLISSILTTILGFCIARWLDVSYGLNDTCTRHTSKYSPILEDINISYNVVGFDGRFTQENIYRQDAGPEVDAAWEALGVGYRPVLISDSLAAKSGIKKYHAHRNPKHGGGYPVFVEGLHQLHCLNLVRQSLYYNYDYYHSLGHEAFGDSDPVLHWHVSHCLDIIRQRLMCTMDIGVFGSVWVGNHTSPRPFVDFNTEHVCRNFDAIRAWAEQNQVPEKLEKDFWEVPGADVKVWEVAP